MSLPPSVTPAPVQAPAVPHALEAPPSDTSEAAPPVTADPLVPPRRRRWRRAVVVAFAAVLALVLGAVTGTVAHPHLVALPRFVGGIEDPERDRAVRELLDRRERAVREGDRELFVADVDAADPAFVRHQEQTFGNLRKLPIGAEYFHDVDAAGWHTDARWDRRFGGRVLLAKVTIRYRFAGFDVAIGAAPWIPAFIRRGDGWRLVGQASGPQYPPGSGAQLWDAGPLAVHRAGQILVIGSAKDESRLTTLARTAAAGIRRVPNPVPGWKPGLVLVVVRDLAVLRALVDDPATVDDYGGVAVPQLALVPDWVSGDTYVDLVGGRVVLHPGVLAEGEHWLSTLIAHEYAHVTVMPWTYDTTPMWLVEGYADHVAERGSAPTETYSFRTLRDAAAGDALPAALPTEESFSGEGADVSYAVAWLACRYFSERYGEAKLLALYRWFAAQVDTAEQPVDHVALTDRGLRAVVGVGADRFTRDMFAYGDRLLP